MTAGIKKMKALALAATQRVEACIADVMARFPTDSKDYYVEVHQHLAPLARQLERANDELRAEVERLRAELAAGAARQGGNTSQCVGCEGSPSSENSPCAVCGCMAPATGTVDGDAAPINWRALGYVEGATVRMKIAGAGWEDAIIKCAHGNGALDVDIYGKTYGWSARYCSVIAAHTKAAKEPT